MLFQTFFDLSPVNYPVLQKKKKTETNAETIKNWTKAKHFQEKGKYFKNWTRNLLSKSNLNWTEIWNKKSKWNKNEELKKNTTLE